MSATTLVSAGTVTAPTGSAMQHHEIFDGTRFWHFYLESATAQSLKSFYSTDRVTWTAGAALALGLNHGGDGREFSITFINISGNLIVGAAIGLTASGPRQSAFYARGVISGTTLTWGAIGDVDSGHGTTGLSPVAIDVAFDTNNKPTVLTSSANGQGNGVSYLASNADAGTSWTAGFAASKAEFSPSQQLHAACLFALASANMFAISDNGTVTTATCYTNSKSSKLTTNWSAGASVFASDLGAAVDADNWGATLVSVSDVHCVQRSGSNTFIHRRWNGTSWGAGSAITNQTSKAGGGCALGYDGTNLYLAVIDSDAANTVRYCSWTSGGGWTAWTTLESSTQTRTNIGIVCSASLTGVYWTQTNGSNFDIVAANITGGGGGGGSSPTEPQLERSHRGMFRGMGRGMARWAGRPEMRVQRRKAA